LGPILFLIYITDLPEICEDIYLYADDAKINLFVMTLITKHYRKISTNSRNGQINGNYS